MTLKLNPLRTLLRCHWLGRFAKPTYPVSFLRTMFMSLAAAAAALGSLDEMVVGAGAEACWLCTAFICSTRPDPAERGGDGDARVGAVGDAPLDAVCLLAGVDIPRRGASARGSGMEASAQPHPSRVEHTLQELRRRAKRRLDMVLRSTVAGTDTRSGGTPYPWWTGDRKRKGRLVKERLLQGEFESAQASMIDEAAC